MKIVQRLFVSLIFTTFGLANLFAAAPEEPLVTYHFVGFSALAKSPDAAKLKEIWEMPETKTFRDDVLQKLARASAKFFGADSANAKQTALIRPLFDDVLAVESRAQLTGAQKSRATLFLAARLSDERSRLWETSLQQLVKASKSEPVKIDGATGWQAKAGANALKFLRAEKWTIVALGPEQPADFLKQLQKQSTVSPSGKWLEANIDWPRLNGLLPLEKIPLKLARTEMEVGGKGEYLRTTARIVYPEKVSWKAEPWRIPKEWIHDPLISFTAARNTAPFWRKPLFPAQMVSNPLTNQIFFWGQSQMPFQFYFATPVKDATNTIKKLGPQLIDAFNDDLKRRDAGKLNFASNKVDVIWQGLPIIGPFMRPAKEKSGAEFLLGGLFPMAPSTNQPPAELFEQFSRNDVVFYDWEITQQRLAQWSMVGQLLPIFAKEPLVTTNVALQGRLAPAKMPELKWVGTVGPKLGNTITEVTYKSPTELNVVRRSHIGLNSIELILFSHWLAHPNFPYVNPFATLPAEQVAKPSAKPQPPTP